MNLPLNFSFKMKKKVIVTNGSTVQASVLLKYLGRILVRFDLFQGHYIGNIHVAQLSFMCVCVFLRLFPSIGSQIAHTCTRPQAQGYHVSEWGGVGCLYELSIQGFV
jgi:hypothetical protein